MTTTIREWGQSHYYESTVRQLRALPATKLRSLGIAPSQIDHLALEASRAEHPRIHRVIIILLAVFGLLALLALEY